VRACASAPKSDRVLAPGRRIDAGERALIAVGTDEQGARSSRRPHAQRCGASVSWPRETRALGRRAVRRRQGPASRAAIGSLGRVRDDHRPDTATRSSVAVSELRRSPALAAHLRRALARSAMTSPTADGEPCSACARNSSGLCPRRLRPSGAEFRVAKNTLRRIASACGRESWSPCSSVPTADHRSFPAIRRRGKTLSDFGRTSRSSHCAAPIWTVEAAGRRQRQQLATLPRANSCWQIW